MDRKTVLITGASRGIGRATAELFAKKGYDLTLNAVKSVSILQEYAEYLTKKYRIRAEVYPGDVSDFGFVKKMIDFAVSGLGGIDVLVNNAGISGFSLVQDMKPEQWHRIMDVNLSSVFYTCSLAVPEMIKKKNGRIINISSIWGEAGAACEAAYSASKGGIIAFSKALAKELAPSHISVNVVSPGIIDTDMNQCFDDIEREELKERIPVGRLGGSDEVARVIVELAEAPSFLTAQVIRVDGGML